MQYKNGADAPMPMSRIRTRTSIMERALSSWPGLAWPGYPESHNPLFFFSFVPRDLLQS